ncbi:MAG: hypothetical protein K6E44_06850 [Bacteroidales bacterium]|nr:hypothetical protein [Bacteroidales bacterium]
MKNIFKYIVILAAGALAFQACDKWTDAEPVEVVYKDLKSKNPQLWAKYMESIRNYHNTDHQVLIAKFDNKATTPEGRGEHINCLPDSVDYVILNNADNLNDVIASEMQELLTEKYIPTLMNIDLVAMIKEYNSMLADEAESKDPESEDETLGVDTPERFVSWIGIRVKTELEIADKYNYSGINVIFSGKNPASMTDAQKEEAIIRQQGMFSGINDWISAHQKAIVLFEGSPRNVLVETAALTSSKYIIIAAESAGNEASLSYAINNVLDDFVPSDRFVIGVTAVDITDPTNTNGSFGSKSAIVGAAEWNAQPTAKYGKKGVCVNHAQFDYYDITNVYSQINKAISIMNPSPVK